MDVRIKTKVWRAVANKTGRFHSTLACLRALLAACKTFLHSANFANLNSPKGGNFLL